MDDLQNREYNGWENKWTWLVHLHLSNEQPLFLEIAQLVASEPNDESAGRLVETWVRTSIANWINRFLRRDRHYDEQIGLLVWDLLGAALAYTEWDELVTLLCGDEGASNVFTATLSHQVQQWPWLHTHLEVVIRHTSSVVAAADALKAWFEALLAEWIDKMVVGRKIDAAIAPVFSALLEGTYDLIAWEHVARAFRPGY